MIFAKTIFRAAVVIACALLSIFSAGCSSDDRSSVNHKAPSDIDADVLSDADVPGDAAVVEDATPEQDSEASSKRPQVSSSESRDLSGLLWECDCPREDDACNIHGRCMRTDRFCSNDEECPSDYTCNYQGLCECALESCRSPSCQVDEECPLFYRCDGTGHCNETHRCAGTISCPVGEVCHEFFAPNPSGGSVGRRTACDTPGPKGPGEACEFSYQCSSGECDADGRGPNGRCANICLTNEDCEGTERCKLDVRDPEPDKRSICTSEFLPCEENEVWVRNTGFDGCVDRLCYNSGDCPESDCIMGWGDVSPGYCDPVPPPGAACKPGEVTDERFSELCWLIDSRGCFECEPPYRCFGVGEHGYRDLGSQCVRDR